MQNIKWKRVHQKISNTQKTQTYVAMQQQAKKQLRSMNWITRCSTVCGIVLSSNRKVLLDKNTRVIICVDFFSLETATTSLKSQLHLSQFQSCHIARIVCRPCFQWQYPWKCNTIAIRTSYVQHLVSIATTLHYTTIIQHDTEIL